MCLPFRKTNPTKLVLTLVAGNMVAAFIFLNRDFANRARFGKLFDPLNIGRILHVFHIPCFDLFINFSEQNKERVKNYLFARTGKMGFLITGGTIFEVALALYLF